MHVTPPVDIYEVSFHERLIQVRSKSRRATLRARPITRRRCQRETKIVVIHNCRGCPVPPHFRQVSSYLVNPVPCIEYVCYRVEIVTTLARPEADVVVLRKKTFLRLAFVTVKKCRANFVTIPAMPPHSRRVPQRSSPSVARLQL